MTKYFTKVLQKVILNYLKLKLKIMNKNNLVIRHLVTFELKFSIIFCTDSNKSVDNKESCCEGLPVPQLLLVFL